MFCSEREATIHIYVYANTIATHMIVMWAKYSYTYNVYAVQQSTLRYYQLHRTNFRGELKDVSHDLH